MWRRPRSTGERVVKVAPEALTLLAREAFVDCQHLLRPGHLAQLRAILDDPEASANDRFVAFDLLKNANIAAGKVLPMCQDTGTAIVMGKKGQQVWTGGDDAAALSEGIRRTYTETHLRYSQVAPLSMYEEVNTGDNLPAQIDLYAEPGDQYKFLFIAKGGGSANKSFLYQQTKAVLNPKSLRKFIDEKLRTLGTAACPPYHLAIVIGGTSAEMNLKTVKLASCRYLDSLPTSGNKYGQAYRDRDFEAEVLELTRGLGIGAQFGGKYFCHDIRVIRLPRHGASLPIGIGVSCSADRQILGKINAEGVFVEQLETDPARYLPEIDEATLGGEVVRIDLSRPMDEIRRTLSQYPIKTRLSLSGTLIVARDIAHAKLQERIDRGEGLPQYVKDHPIYYAGPAKTPEGYASGRSGRRRRAGWTAMSARSWRRAAASSRSRKAIAAPRCARRASNTAGFISARSADRRRGWRWTASRRSSCSNIRNSGWRRSGASRWSISRPLSSSTTRATISSRRFPEFRG